MVEPHVQASGDASKGRSRSVAEDAGRQAGLREARHGVGGTGDERQVPEGIGERGQVVIGRNPELVEHPPQGVQRHRVEVGPAVHRGAQPRHLELPRPPPRGNLRAAPGCQAIARVVQRLERQERPEQIEEDGVDRTAGRCHRGRSWIHVTRPARSSSTARWASSTEPSSSIVLMSPGSRSSATALRTRRMILPLRVLGSIGTNET